MKKFKAKMTCSFHSGRKFAISIDDRTSGVHVCTIEMEPEAFALMLAGHAFQDGEAELINSYDFVGKTKEMRPAALTPRDQWLEKSHSAKKNPAAIEELEAALLATAPPGEGWQVWCNGTRTQQNDRDTYRGSLYRYVETPTTPTPPTP